MNQQLNGQSFDSRMGNLLASIPGRMRAVIVNPAQFFSTDMPRSGGYVEPLVFIVVMAVVTALVMAIVGLFGFGPVGMMSMGLVGVIILPIMVVIFSFIGTAFVFVVWKIMGSQENFETAYRCVAFTYAYAPLAAIVSGIPYLGGLISSLWPMALLAIASIHVHQRSTNTSWAVFGILGLVFAAMGLSAEHAGRQMTGDMEDWSTQMEKKYGDPDEMTPEEASRAFGEMLKEFQQGNQ